MATKRDAYALSAREVQTILAALRRFQDSDPDERSDCEYFEDVPPLTDDQIDKLCQRLSGNYAP